MKGTRINRELIVALIAVGAILGLLMAMRVIRAVKASVHTASVPVELEAAPTLPDPARAALLRKILEQGNPNDDAGPPVALSIDDFFEGNNDANSIGRGLSQESLERFDLTLSAIARRPNVQAVLLGIGQVSLEDPQAWPRADRVYILAWAPRESVARWLAELKCRQVAEGYPHNVKPPAAPELMEDASVYTASWD